MSFKANVIKKFRRWLNNRAETRYRVRKENPGQSPLGVQVGKLLQSRGSEIITMTTV